MIYTCSHKNYKSDLYNTFAISGNRGRDANYNGKCFPKLAPKLSFWKIWHDNIGVISEEENNKYYIEEYYKQVLSALDPEQIYRELYNSILLCYEENQEFCHRHIVAAWLEILLDIEVPEIKVEGLHIENIERPSYIKEYLEEVMKKNKNMRDFNSLRALYLFEKGESLEQRANELEKVTDKCYDYYREEAYYFRCDAYQVEEEYNKNSLIKIKS